MSKGPDTLKINSPEEVLSIEWAGFLAEVTSSDESSIDSFYLASTEIFRRAIDEHAQPSEAFVNRLLLLGLVSSAETYFREVIARVLVACPRSRLIACQQDLKWGAALYFEDYGTEIALLDGKNFSGSQEIKSATSKFLGFDVSKSSSLVAALDDYERVCQLRHAVVHAGGRVGFLNAVSIGADRSRPTVVNLGLNDLERVRGVTYNVVRAYNRFAFSALLERLIAIDEWKGNWAIDKQIYKPLFDTFYSKHDAGSKKLNAYQAYRKILPAIRARKLG